MCHLEEIDCESDDSEFWEGHNSSAYMTENLTCIPFSEAFEQTAIDAPQVQVAFGILYSFIWIFSIASNGMVLFVAMVTIVGGRRTIGRRVASSFVHRSTRRSSSQVTIARVSHQRPASFSVRTVFVISLACSDLLTALASMPITAFNIFTHQWYLGQFLCKAIGFMQAFAIFQSSFTFSFIAVDRYLIVAYPDAEIITYKTARWALALMALFAGLLAAPMYFFVDTVITPGLCGEFCVESWPEPSDIDFPVNLQRFYSLFILILQFGLPASVTTACYLLVAGLLRQRHRRRISSWCRSACERRLNARRRRMNRMMSVMVLGYVLAWSPFNALSLLRDFELFPYLFDTRSFSVLFACSHLIAMTTLVLNPVIYAWFNRWVRDAVFGVFRRCRSY